MSEKIIDHGYDNEPVKTKLDGFIDENGMLHNTLDVNIPTDINNESEEKQTLPVTDQEITDEVYSRYGNYSDQEKDKIDSYDTSGVDKDVAKIAKQHFENRQQIIMAAQNKLDGSNNLEDILGIEIHSKQALLDRQTNHETDFYIKLKNDIEDLLDVIDSVTATRQHYADNTNSVPWARQFGKN